MRKKYDGPRRGNVAALTADVFMPSLEVNLGTLKKIRDKIAEIVIKCFIFINKLLVSHFYIKMVRTQTSHDTPPFLPRHHNKPLLWFHNWTNSNVFQHKLKSSQREKVKKFISFTQTGENTAIYCLAQNDWKLDLASDNYFQNPDAYYKEPRSVDKKKLETLYVRYRDPGEPDKITVDGIMKFLDDMNLPPESKLVLIVAWKFKAATQCEFSRDEFVNGMTDLGCDSIDKLKQRLPGLETELRDVYKFKDFYQFTFNFAKNPNQKGLDLDMAIAYWNIVLKGKFKFLDMWCTFLKVRGAVRVARILLSFFAGEPSKIHSERHVEPSAGFRAADIGRYEQL